MKGIFARTYKSITASTAILLMSASCSIKSDSSQLSLSWTDFGVSANTGIADNQFVIKNTSDMPIEGNWALHYSQLHRNIISVETEEVDITAVNGNHFKITPTGKFTHLPPGDSIIVRYTVSAKTPNVSQEPEGAFIVVDGQKPVAVPFVKQSAPKDIETLTVFAERVYEQNSQIVKTEHYGVLPSVKQRMLNNGTCTSIAEKEIKLIKADVQELSTKLAKAEGYKLVINSEGVTIYSPTEHGLFYGMQTYRRLIANGNKEIPCQTIIDYPDLGYRGLMLDIARNFTPLENIRKMIALMSSYKLNVLHLHLADDEGWRLEIPGIEELTSIASRRGFTLNEHDCLYPVYDGNFDPTAATTGNGFINRKEFIELLKYAAEHYVTIIPEIDTPGHSRAAIKAMNARYDKYAKTDMKRAEEYLLTEKSDTSKYTSAQSYTDNVVNMALSSTYRFIEKVAKEIKLMYDEAGIPLTTLHLGGDECAEGAWLGSPSCRKIMAKNDWNTTHELYQQYYLKANDIMKKLGIRISGWQEAAYINADTERMNNYKENFEGVYCWNTVPEWGDDKVPYEVANNGFPVILCNVNNFYLDLAYSPLYEERGHCWAGYVDESKSFAAMPFNIYRSTRTDLNGMEWNLDSVAQGKPVLTETGKANIKGVQAQLFSETIRGCDWVEYYVFPKILGLVERGWNAHPAWENSSDLQTEKNVFYNELSKFYSQLSRHELPCLSKNKVNYRIPAPGMVVRNGQLLVNTPIEGAEIRYTTDGTEPVKESQLWTQPVTCQQGIIKAKTFFLDKESVSMIIKN